MCRIFGFVGSSDAAARTDIDAVLSTLRHRGPDDHGTYAETFSIAGKGDQTCILAQTRLSVIDLFGGASADVVAGRPMALRLQRRDLRPSRAQGGSREGRRALHWRL